MDKKIQLWYYTNCGIIPREALQKEEKLDLCMRRLFSHENMSFHEMLVNVRVAVFGSWFLIHRIRTFFCLQDPDPELFVPIRIRIWLRSRILPKQTKKLRKYLISTVLWLLNDFLSLKIDVNVPTVSNKLNNLEKKPIFRWRVESLWRNLIQSRIRICISKRHGSGTLILRHLNWKSCTTRKREG